MKNKAFTLIETLIAITLTTVVLTAVCGLVLTTLFANQRNTHSLQALYYAEEGLEAARFMRDSNWLQNYSWDFGTMWGGDIHTDSSDSEKTFYLVAMDCSSTEPCFQLSTDVADGTIETPEGFAFVRSLTYKFLDSSEVAVSGKGAVEVISKVEWQEHGITRNFILSTYLTAWQ
ncbi:MAG: prepilin-type N-terminal cleavage/methylation domain-containing protein [Candidatus Gracilibacteria bacterium]|jgi:Tfp pilus assembly protein PilV